MLTLDNITCVRGGKVLFRELGLTIGDRAFIVIRGGNGVGKTSLLRIVAQLLEPTSGKVTYANENVRGEHFEEYCDIVSYLGHQQALKENNTVYDNIAFWAKMRGNASLIPAVLSYFELEPYRDIEVRKLSAGLKQRVSLSSVMVSNGDIWLLDEPLSHLDAHMVKKVVSLLETRCAQGGSVVMTTHTDIPMDGKYELCLDDWKVCDVA
jgi:heme exporter protein A